MCSFKIVRQFMKLSESSLKMIILSTIRIMSEPISCPKSNFTAHILLVIHDLNMLKHNKAITDHLKCKNNEFFNHARPEMLKGEAAKGSQTKTKLACDGCGAPGQTYVGHGSAMGSMCARAMVHVRVERYYLEVHVRVMRPYFIISAMSHNTNNYNLRYKHVCKI